MGKSDPLVDALDALAPTRGGQRYRVEVLFGDRPELLDAIRRNYERGTSPDAIVKVLNDGQPPERRLSSSAVENWLKNRPT